MNDIPQTENALVLRTDFSDSSAWQSVCAAIKEPVGEFRAYVDCISDAAYDGLTVEQLVALGGNDSRSFMFVDWHFTTENARVKLKYLCPSL
jgi:hypothetical protein